MKLLFVSNLLFLIDFKIRFSFWRILKLMFEDNVWDKTIFKTNFIKNKVYKNYRLYKWCQSLITVPGIRFYFYVDSDLENPCLEHFFKIYWLFLTNETFSTNFQQIFLISSVYIFMLKPIRDYKALNLSLIKIRSLCFKRQTFFGRF